MKVVVVPAQVTTVEDRIVGRLNFLQLILLVAPIFGGALIYVSLPPNMTLTTYKVLLIGCIALVSLTMAIRVRGRIILLWSLTLLRYRMRPRIYIFNKNTDAWREVYLQKPVSPTVDVVVQEAQIHQTTQRELTQGQIAIVHAALSDPVARVRYEATNTGGLYVHLTKTKQ